MEDQLCPPGPVLLNSQWSELPYPNLEHIFMVSFYGRPNYYPKGPPPRSSAILNNQLFELPYPNLEHIFMVSFYGRPNYYPIGAPPPRSSAILNSQLFELPYTNLEHIFMVPKDSNHYSCIDTYSYSCFNPLSNERKSTLKSGDSHAV